jgi:hypothetical protein
MEKFIENNLNVPKSRAYGNEAVKQVMAGLGCSIMPLIGVKNELNNEFTNCSCVYLLNRTGI